MSIFIRGVFSFACHLHFNQEILLRAESCLCPDPKAWGLANVFACNLIFLSLLKLAIIEFILFLESYSKSLPQTIASLYSFFVKAGEV